MDILYRCLEYPKYVPPGIFRIEWVNTLGGTRYFCSLDLASGYWHVEMHEEDREKTAFIMQGGLYEFKVMPLVLVNAPATSKRLMERVLRDVAWMEFSRVPG